MNAIEFKNKLEQLKACDGAVEWAEGKDLQTCWETCHRGDWMLWLYRRADNYTLKEFTLAKAYCANTVKHLIKDERSLKSLQAAFDFGNGLISENELRAYTYGYPTAADAATYAATAADAATYAATYAAIAADASADAATYAATIAAADAAYAAAKKNNQKLTADICRKYLPLPKFN